MTPDTSGLSSVRPFASYDPASRSWRTWTAIEASDSTEWSETWPKTGCMSDGLSYQLPAWEPRIDASGCSSPSLPTLIVGSTSEASHGQISGQWRDAMTPTPTTSDTNGSGAHGDGGRDLRTAVSDLACDYCGEPRIPSRCDNCDAGPTRAAVFAGDWGDFLPTPRAGDGEKGGPNQRGSSGDLMLPSAVAGMLPTPTGRDWKDHEIRREPHRPNDTDTLARALTDVPASLLPTPTAASDGNTPETHLARKPGRMEVTNLEVMARGGLLPTTTTTDAKASGAADYTTGHAGTTLTDATVRQPSRWGKYAAAVARWERITRPAPEPTNITEGYLKARAKRLARLDKRPVGMRGSLKVRRQLAARFSEWMMGVPLGWITDVPGVTRNEALKAAGNGVVPQQAAEALRFLLDMPTGRDVADAHEPLDLFELLAVGE